MPTSHRGKNSVYSVHASKLPKAFDPKLVPGDIYFLQEERESYVVTVDRDLVLVGKLLCVTQGPAGETGARGPIGWPGKDGSNSTIPGPAGKSIQGPGGPIGLDGRAATIHIGKVTTVPHGKGDSVVNVGTARDAILDFQIPEGPSRDGRDGKDGATGPRGEKGERGDLLYVTDSELKAAFDKLKAKHARLIAHILKKSENAHPLVKAHFKNLLAELQK